MFEPIPNVGEGHFGISPFQRLSKFAFRVSSNTTQFGFDFRDALFFGIQVGRVGAPSVPTGPRGGDQRDDGEFLLGGDIIPDDNRCSDKVIGENELIENI